MLFVVRDLSTDHWDWIITQMGLSLQNTASPISVFLSYLQSLLFLGLGPCEIVPFPVNLSIEVVLIQIMFRQLCR